MQTLDSIQSEPEDVLDRRATLELAHDAADDAVSFDTGDGERTRDASAEAADHVVAVAEELLAADAAPSPTALLRALAAHAGTDGSESGPRLYDAFVRGRGGARSPFGGAFELAVASGEPIEGRLRRGDLLLQRPLGANADLASVSVVVGDAIPAARLAEAGLRPIDGRDGRFAHVVEVGALSRGLSGGWARRVAGPDGRLPRGLIGVRRVEPGDAASIAYTTAGADAAAYRPDARYAPAALRLAHTALEVTVLPARFLPEPTADAAGALALALTLAGVDERAQRGIDRAGLLPFASAFGADALAELFVRLRWDAARIAREGAGADGLLVPRLLAHVPGHFRELARRAPNERDAHALESLGWWLANRLVADVERATGRAWWIPAAPAFAGAFAEPLGGLGDDVRAAIRRLGAVDAAVKPAAHAARLERWRGSLACRQWRAETSGARPGLPFHADLVRPPVLGDAGAALRSLAQAWRERVADADRRFPTASPDEVSDDGMRKAAALRKCDNDGHVPHGVLERAELTGLELAFDYPQRRAAGRPVRLLRGLPVLGALRPAYDGVFRALAELGWNDLVPQSAGAACFRGVKLPPHDAFTSLGPGLAAALVGPARAAVKRAIAASRRLSEHGRGAAIDCNSFENAQDSARPRGSMDPRVVALFDAFGFRWGAAFPTPDPMHFEHVHATSGALDVEDPVDLDALAVDLVDPLPGSPSSRRAFLAGVPDTRVFPHSAICQLRIRMSRGGDSWFTGTGFFVARDRILTAGHNVFHSRFGTATRIVVMPGRNGAETPFPSFAVDAADMVAHPGWIALPSRADFDLAVLRTPASAPNGRWFAAEELKRSAADGVAVCGYAAELSKGADPDRQNMDRDHVRSLDGESFTYGLNTTKGTSGSPVFVPGARTAAVGVHSRSNDRTTNRGCRLTDAKLAWVRAVLHDGVASVTVAPWDVPADAIAPFAGDGRYRGLTREGVDDGGDFAGAGTTYDADGKLAVVEASSGSGPFARRAAAAFDLASGVELEEAPFAVEWDPDVDNEDDPDADVAGARWERPPGVAGEDYPGLPKRVSLRDANGDVNEALSTLLQRGCYHLCYRTAAATPVIHDGTFRVQRSVDAVVASGDYYRRPSGGSAPSPSAGVPIFKRSDYAGYFRVTRVSEAPPDPKAVELRFERWTHNATTHAWTKVATEVAILKASKPPAGYPAGATWFSGDVKSTAGTVTGSITLGWAAEMLRRATVEIDRVPVSESPLDNGAGVSWRTIFRQIGYDLKLVESHADVAEPSGESWSDAELHAAMLAKRDASDLDSEWRFHVLCVRRLDSTSRGIMYDAYAGDSNNIPREGAAISSHWTIPNAAIWGGEKGKRFGASKPAYFRTAVHELSHAFGLYHPGTSTGGHVMQTTEVIAGNGTAATQFPKNIQWSHSFPDRQRLRHLPDVWVRPGGIPFGKPYSTVPQSDNAEEPAGLVLAVRPVEEVLPLGAPARFEIELRNVATDVARVPDSLSLKDGYVSGAVTGPSGAPRDFRPLVLCPDELDQLTDLAPGASLGASVTLLRGGDGALFELPGVHRVRFDVEWEHDGRPQRISGDSAVIVTAPVDAGHARAALRVLTSPDSLLVLALGGDHLDEGLDAIQAALDDPVLRPHFAYVEAKRLARRFGWRAPDQAAAVRLLDEASVLSESEARNAARWLADASDSLDDGHGASLRRMLAERGADGPDRRSTTVERNNPGSR